MFSGLMIMMLVIICWNFFSKIKISYFSKLTNICTQSVQRKPTTTVPMAPNKRPEFLNAIGIAKIPVPKELFSRCIREPDVLNEIVFQKIVSKLNF